MNKWLMVLGGVICILYIITYFILWHYKKWMPYKYEWYEEPEEKEQ